MKLTAPLKITVFALSSMLALAIGCRDEEDRLHSARHGGYLGRSFLDAYYQDVDDMAGVTLNTSTDDQYSGRIAATITVQDSRFKCSGIVVTITPSTASTKTTPQGVITVDFGTGCTDAAGNVRTGKLVFTYSGWRFQPGSTVVATTDNYSVNGIKLTGTRTLTNVSGSTSAAPKFNAVLTNGVATFTDGRTATRESNITWSWVKGEAPGGCERPTDNRSEQHRQRNNTRRSLVHRVTPERAGL